MLGVEQTATGVSLTVHVQPGAKCSQFSGSHRNALKVKIAARPVAGKANAALCKFVAKVAGVPTSRVTLVSGEKSRDKRLVLHGCTLADLMPQLLADMPTKKVLP